MHNARSGRPSATPLRRSKQGLKGLAPSSERSERQWVFPNQSPSDVRMRNSTRRLIA
jgi:hypothetical protein